MLRRICLSLILLFLIISFAGSPVAADEYGSDIDQFLTAGANYYLAWQYSGDKSSPLPNDRFSFFQGSATCATLKTKAAQYPGRIGVNIYSLSNLSVDEIRTHLTYVKNSCGASIVRFWGFDSPSSVTKVLNVGKQIGGLKFIVALADFGSIPQSNPTNWYLTGYLSSYKTHAEQTALGINNAGLADTVYALELVNEPHCFGVAGCVSPYADWANTMATLLASKGFRVGIGQKSNENTTRGDSPRAGSPADFRVSNNFSSIGTTSGHYYSATEKTEVMLALNIAKSLGKQFYVGEAGFTESTTSPVSGPAVNINPQTAGFDRFEYPCNETTDNKPEFNPQRPYPGSPCDPLIPASWPEKNPMSFACGKSLNVGGKVDISPVRPTQEMPANPEVGVPYWCDSAHLTACIVKPFEYDININLSGANIPILGNTQDSLSDATRVNQYLLSYLSGTVQEADQKPLDKSDPKAIDRLVNFVGPLKKLLSFDSQNKLKSNLVAGPIGTSYHDYVAGCNQVISLNAEDYVNAILQILKSGFSNVVIQLTAAKQLAEVAIKYGIEVFVPLGNALFKAGGMYAGLQGSPADRAAQLAVVVSADLSKELDDAALISLLTESAQIIIEAAGPISQNIGAAFASIKVVEPNQAVACLNANAATTQVRISEIRGNLPPTQKADETFSEYWDRYLAWHGDTLLTNRSVWASLLQNVPFETLEDTVSEFTISAMDDPKQQPEGVITGNSSKAIKLTITGGDSRIIVPHVKAINSLSQLLQNLILPQPEGGHTNFDPNQNIGAHQTAASNPEAQKIEVVTNPSFCLPGIKLVYNSFLCNNSSVVPPSLGVITHVAPPPLFTTHDSICDLKDIRVNPGDDVYGQNVSAKLTYYQKFTYTPTTVSPGFCTPNGDSCLTPTDCCSGQCNLRDENDPSHGRYCAGTNIQKDNEARVAVFSKIPLIDNIYDKLVSGSQSVLRRFLAAQSCEPNCSDEQRKHYIRKDAESVPAAINASYTGQGTVTAGDKTGGGQIYIPRLGSMFDYLLGAAKENMNLQKMLRPKGVGGTGEAGLAGLHNESMAQIATRLGVPVEFLDAIWLLETGRAPSGSYCECADGTACGPMAIDQYNFERILTREEQTQFNRCLLPDAFELSARVLLHKKYCTLAACTYDPANPTSNGGLTLDDLIVVGRYIGVNSCEPEPQSQCRWGPTVSYCDAIQSIVYTGSLPPAGSPTETAPYCQMLK